MLICPIVITPHAPLHNIQHERTLLEVIKKFVHDDTLKHHKRHSSSRHRDHRHKHKNKEKVEAGIALCLCFDDVH